MPLWGWVLACVLIASLVVLIVGIALFSKDVERPRESQVSPVTTPIPAPPSICKGC